MYNQKNKIITMPVVVDADKLLLNIMLLSLSEHLSEYVMPHISTYIDKILISFVASVFGIEVTPEQIRGLTIDLQKCPHCGNMVVFSGHFQTLNHHKRYKCPSCKLCFRRMFKHGDSYTMEVGNYGK